MSFPWNRNAVLWVDDNPDNNKDLMQALESRGIMTIPRVSTKQALDFLHFMDKVFLKDESSQYRIVTDMERYEKKNENDSEVIRVKNAGAVLIHHLRERGYYNEICVYTNHTKNALEKCHKLGCKEGIIALDNPKKCFKFCLNRVDNEVISQINFKIESNSNEQWNEISAKAVKSNNEMNSLIFRKIFKEGWLEKKSQYIGKWNPRWVVLTDDVNDSVTLYTFKKKKQYENPTRTIVINGDFHVEDAMLINDHIFTLRNRCTQQKYVFKASNESIKRSWIDLIHWFCVKIT
eukprot:300907_1